MTNEEKAIELAENISPYDIGGDNAAHYAAKDAALDAMEWKDEQHKQEKQQWIDNSCEWIEQLMVASDNYDAYDIQENLRDFKEAMKGEQQL